MSTTSVEPSETGETAQPGPGDTSTRHPVRPLRRSADNARIGGVCAGLARRLGVPTRAVRILAFLSIFVAGLGILAYVACWAVIVRDGEDHAALTRVLEDRRQLQIVLAVGTVVVAVLVLLAVLGLHEPGFLAWPLLLSAVCALCIWRGASDDERADLQERIDAARLVNAATSTSWRTIALRACVGAALLLFGGVLLSKVGTLRGAAIGVFIGVVLVSAGFLVLFAPWWLRTVRDLTAERRARFRAQERADLAAHLHDSVLQTLLLIQKSSGEPAEVIRLARRQERELRAWLFDPSSNARGGESFASAARTIERDVEDDYGVRIELVVVGDCDLDEQVRALLAAGREAAVNAAKWSGAAHISMYAEVEPESVSLFVRDLGQGFDPDAVEADRQGIACSIRERMTRNGGTATIRSSPGHGTEVELVLPRSTVES